MWQAEVEVSPGRWLPLGPPVNDGVGRLIDINIQTHENWGNAIRVLKMEHSYCTPIPFPTTPETVRMMTGLDR